nr:hypothetical protein CcurKRNrm1_p124 [Cryptomonas curvata]
MNLKKNFQIFKRIKQFNFTHKSQECSWKEKFEYLHIFKETYGHSNVPQRYEYNPGLGAWVSKQRGYFFKSKISENRVEFLKFLNFDWAPGKHFTFSAAWNKRYKELKYFKIIYGHCNVPCKYIQNKELGFWVKNQRQFFKKGIIEYSRIFLLTELGFEWARRDSFVKMTWEQRFKELEIYINKYGNSLVPQRSGALGKWVQTQRDLYRKKLIKEERKQLLNNIKFIWEPRDILVGGKKNVFFIQNKKKFFDKL